MSAHKYWPKIYSSCTANGWPCRACALMHDPAELPAPKPAQVKRDPADDAAWPLPEGWRWNSRFAYKADDFHTVWVEDGAMRVLGARTVGIPLAVVRTLLARWEAGQA